MIGGGYGTGREVVEYFTRFGAGPGLLGLALAGVGIAVVFALSLELARRATEPPPRRQRTDSACY